MNEVHPMPGKEYVASHPTPIDALKNLLGTHDAMRDCGCWTCATIRAVVSDFERIVKAHDVLKLHLDQEKLRTEFMLTARNDALRKLEELEHRHELSNKAYASVCERIGALKAAVRRCAADVLDEDDEE